MTCLSDQMTTIVFTIPGVARGKQRPRATRQGRVYTPAQTKNAEAFIRLLATQAMKGGEPLDGPIEATFMVSVEIPKSFSKQKHKDALEGRLYPTSKPDLDNIVKLLADALNGIVYKDDKQIVDMFVNKVYSEHAETVVMIKPKGTDNGKSGADRRPS
jgi:Holliday junction resolvase RusA-like endonuclease